MLALLLVTLGFANPGTHTLFAGGDTSLSRWVHQCYAKRGYEEGFDGILDLTRDSDVALTNLEGVVATTGDFNDKGEKRPYLYRGRPELLDFVTHAGFDIVTTANNHAMDYGPEALLEQQEFLTAAGIAWVGSGVNLAAARAPRYVQVDDVTLAFIGVEDYAELYAATEDQPGSFHADPEDLVDALRGPIATARQHADLVVVSPHWGKNWTDAPTPERIETAHALIDMGADAILGHSSHHIHGVEVYRGHPIVYDMGSLFFDAVGQENLRFSAGWQLRFDADGFHELEIHPLRLHSCRVEKAKGQDLERIQTWLDERSHALDPDLELQREGDVLHVALSPETEHEAPTAPPDAVHIPGQTRRLPAELRDRQPAGIVLDAPPDWCEGEPVDAGNGVRILCARTSQAVRPKRAFVADVVLEVSGPLTGRWEGVIRGRRRDGTEGFMWMHPIADGAWIPDKWEARQIVVDRTLVRPDKVPPGTYDLTWALVDVDNHGMEARRRSATLDPSERPIGSIQVRRRGIPSGAAGVAWDGLLPDGEGAPPPESVPTSASTAQSVLLALGAVGLLVVLGLASLLRRRDT